jgi:hypothetical protein
MGQEVNRKLGGNKMTGILGIAVFAAWVALVRKYIPPKPINVGKMFQARVEAAFLAVPLADWNISPDRCFWQTTGLCIKGTVNPNGTVNAAFYVGDFIQGDRAPHTLRMLELVKTLHHNDTVKHDTERTAAQRLMQQARRFRMESTLKGLGV